MTRFSVPVRSSSTDAYWPVRPTLVRTASGSRRMSCPSTRAVPASGTSRVASIRTIVVLPAPLGPSRPKTVPRSTVRSTPSTAVVSPNLLTRPSASIAGAFSMAVTFRGWWRYGPMGGKELIGRSAVSLLRRNRSPEVDISTSPHSRYRGSAGRSDRASGRCTQPDGRVRGHGVTLEGAAGEEHLVTLGQRDRHGPEVRHDDDGGTPLARVAQRDDVLTGGQQLQRTRTEAELGAQRDRLAVHPQRRALLVLLDVRSELGPRLRPGQPRSEERRAGD